MSEINSIQLKFALFHSPWHVQSKSKSLFLFLGFCNRTSSSSLLYPLLVTLGHLHCKLQGHNVASGENRSHGTKVCNHKVGPPPCGGGG